MPKLLVAVTLMLCIVFLSASAAQSDTSIASAVKSKLAGSAAAKGANVTVTCKNGVVTLKGKTTYSQQIAEIGTIASQVAGVKSVNNQLTSAQAAKPKPKGQ